MLLVHLKHCKREAVLPSAFACLSNLNPSVHGTFEFQLLFAMRKPPLKQKATMGRAASSVSDKSTS